MQNQMRNESAEAIHYLLPYLVEVSQLQRSFFPSALCRSHVPVEQVTATLLHHQHLHHEHGQL